MVTVLQKVGLQIHGVMAPISRLVSMEPVMVVMVVPVIVTVMVPVKVLLL